MVHPIALLFVVKIDNLEIYCSNTRISVEYVEYVLYGVVIYTENIIVEAYYNISVSHLKAKISCPHPNITVRLQVEDISMSFPYNKLCIIC